MKNRVITISREFGSGGRTIGKKVAEKLGIPCYDAEIIEKMAKETGFAPDYVKEAGEYAPGSFLSSAFSNRMFGPTNEDILWEHQYKVITDLAAKGSCVIVGRCADYILQDTADCLKVFIHADLAFRAKRIAEVYGEREQSPEERLRDKDKRRAAYHRFYTNMKWGHAQNYHLTLDSGVIGDVIRKSGEDGMILAKSGEAILTADQIHLLRDVVSTASAISPLLDTMQSLSALTTTSGGVDMTIENITLPNVTKPEEFADGLRQALKNDVATQKAVRAITVDLLAGKNSLSVRKY